MTRDQRIIRAVAASYALNKKKVISMLNEHGATVKPESSNEKVLRVLSGFLTSNDKFAKDYLVFLLKKGYLMERDLIIEGSLTPLKVSEYESYAEDADTSAETTTDASGGFYGTLISEGLGLVKGIFKSPEADQATIQGILDIERQKAAAAAKASSNAKYWVAGAAITGILVITGIIIYKKVK